MRPRYFLTKLFLRRRPGLRIGVCVSIAAVCITADRARALDYFGDIAAHRMVLRLKLDESSAGLLRASGIQFLVLKDGQATLSATPDPGKADTVLRGLFEIIDLRRINPRTKRPEPAPYRVVRFTALRNGWTRDRYELTITIPYTVNETDKLQMLNFAMRGEVETRWRDPKSDGVDIISYWSNVGGPTECEVEVVESTLGFANKLHK